MPLPYLNNITSKEYYKRYLFIVVTITHRVTMKEKFHVYKFLYGSSAALYKFLYVTTKLYKL